MDVPLTETIQHSEGQTDEGDDSEALLTADHDTESQSSGMYMHTSCYQSCGY